MRRATWPLHDDRPAIEMTLKSDAAASDISMRMLADTGAGNRRDLFELILREQDCHVTGALQIHTVRLRGAYAGLFPIYLATIAIDELNFEEAIPAVAVPKVPDSFDGIACFRFLLRFAYGNFGSEDSFGLEVRR